MCSASDTAFVTIFGVTVPFICLYQSIPLMWLYSLYANRARLNPPMKDPRLAYEKRRKDHSITHISFLYADYQCNKYYYEVIEMYRRILLLGVLPFIEEPTQRAGFGCIMAALGCILFREFLPYEQVQSNTLALAAQYQVSVRSARYGTNGA